MEHIARHGITPEECEQAYRTGPMVVEYRHYRAQGQDQVYYRILDARETARSLPECGGVMATKSKIPIFKSEKAEAEWWDRHPEVITELFLKARQQGRIKRLPTSRGATKPVTIRMPIADIEAAREIAEKRGLAYQTYIKGLLAPGARTRS